MTVRLDRAAFFAAVLVLLAGYAAIERPAEAAIAERYAELDRTRAALDARLALAHRAGALRAEQTAIERRLAADGVGADRVAIVAAFVRALAGVTDAGGVRIEALAGALAPPAAPAHFEAIGMRIALRGGYAGLIRTLRRLAAVGPAARVTLAELANPSPRSTAEPQLRATFDVALFHLTAPLDGESHATR